MVERADSLAAGSCASCVGHGIAWVLIAQAAALLLPYRSADGGCGAIVPAEAANGDVSGRSAPPLASGCRLALANMFAFSMSLPQGEAPGAASSTGDRGARLEVCKLLARPPESCGPRDVPNNLGEVTEPSTMPQKSTSSKSPSYMQSCSAERQRGESSSLPNPPPRPE